MFLSRWLLYVAGIALLASLSANGWLALSRANALRDKVTAEAKADGLQKDVDALVGANSTTIASLGIVRDELRRRDKAASDMAIQNAQALAKARAAERDANAAARYANEQLAKGYRDPDCAARLRTDVSCAL
jgi:hypothetical protein